jgi:tRNA-dihydrouridine synthase
MLAARQVLSESFKTSPWLRRRPHETYVVYQLMLAPGDPLERILDRLGEAGAEALDLNLACRSRSVRACSAGSALFEDLDSLRSVLGEVRKLWPHVLTAKIRLGHERPDWRPGFVERLLALEAAGADAVILQFFEERFKRRARHELFPWVASLTRLPIIANGDLNGPDTLRAQAGQFESVSAVMLGRMAVIRPWIFANWDLPTRVDLPAVWGLMCHHVAEDFEPALALRRLQMFLKYFAANFKFGHQFKVDLARATSIEDLQHRAASFFSQEPAIVAQPTVAGL